MSSSVSGCRAGCATSPIDDVSTAAAMKVCRSLNMARSLPFLRPIVLRFDGAVARLTDDNPRPVPAFEPFGVDGFHRHGVAWRDLRDRRARHGGDDTMPQRIGG